MTDRARLTEEQVEEIRRHGYSRALWSHELDALCDHALADLRRESAACPAPSAGAVPDGGLSREIDELIEEIPAIRNYYKGCTFTTATKDINRLCDAVMALRSLERPAGRVVPEEPIISAPLDWDNYMLWVRYGQSLRAMLAASPPAATEGWVTDRDELLAALLELEQAYTNKHSPQHRASALGRARSILAKHPSGGAK